jgi:hypothetical protein
MARLASGVFASSCPSAVVISFGILLSRFLSTKCGSCCFVQAKSQQKRLILCSRLLPWLNSCDVSIPSTDDSACISTLRRPVISALLEAMRFARKSRRQIPAGILILIICGLPLRRQRVYFSLLAIVLCSILYFAMCLFTRSDRSCWSVVQRSCRGWFECIV